MHPCCKKPAKEVKFGLTWQSRISGLIFVPELSGIRSVGLLKLYSIYDLANPSIWHAVRMYTINLNPRLTENKTMKKINPVTVA